MSTTAVSPRLPRRSFRRLLPPALATLAFGLPASATLAAPSPLTLADLVRLKSVREAKIAPDGGLVAYTLQVPRRPWEDKDGPAWAELHVVDASGADRTFVGGEVNVGAFAWTADGRALAFLAKRNGEATTALYTIPRDGGEARRRLTHASDLEGFELAPDGRTVVFLSRDKKEKASEERIEHGFDREVVEEEGRPVRVWVGELDATSPARVLDLPGSASELHLAPQGDRVLVALAPTPGIDDEYMARKVQVVALADGRVLARLDHEGKLGHTAWSPDGRQVAMIAAADRHDPSTSRLAVWSVEGGVGRDLFAGEPVHPAAFVWSEPGKLLAIAARGVETDLRNLASTGGPGATTRLDEPAVWTALDRAGDGTMALVGESPTHPAEVFLWKPGAVRPQRLTDSNPWLAERHLGRQSVVRFAARDGLALEGLLIEPVERQAGARVPLVLIVHGGPEAHWSNGWLSRYANPGQVLAGKGFAVFYPNYRGSTGRGLAFSKTSQGDPAGKEFDDLVDAVDALVASGLVDAKRVGITGGSYGGYATAWGSTFYSERFAAGVMFVGITRLGIKGLTTDIPVEDIDVHMMTPPWKREAADAERSPLSYLEKARTPLLIAVGKDDPRVHPSQSLALYRGLKLLGRAPVRLVAYPGEGHGNRRTASQLDFAARLVQWFEHYLLGPGGAPPPAEIDYRGLLGIAADPAGGATPAPASSASR
ncbi:MAG: S9 family peptidase [Holophagales bacterium]|nr:MAG: S9 family peptidase [Holophagales bacterium]